MIIIGKVENMNIGESFFNCNVISVNKERINLKLTKEQARLLKVDRVYEFEYAVINNNDKLVNEVIKVTDVSESLKDFAEIKEKLGAFYEVAPIDINQAKEVIEDYLANIENKVIKKITEILYDKYKANFYLFPAAVKFHHAYLGGLAYHTKTMLNIASKLLEVYDFINKDLVISAIILHDMCKTVELSGFEGGEYTRDGQLIGHLVLIAQQLMIEAAKLDLEESEEIIQLNHILLAHHGLPNFGAARRPQTAEALLVWYIDTIDSKFRVLEEVLNQTEAGTFTGIINVADKMKYYKHKVK